MLKKILYSLTIISLFATSSLTVMSCEPVKSFPSVSATTTISNLNNLFIGKEIQPVYFDYLKYINGFFEHSNFSDVLSTNKVTTNKIETSKLSEANVIYYNALKNIYKPIEIGTELDFSGMTFIIENIFIDDFAFVKNNSTNQSPKKINENENESQEEELLSYANTTMAITILKGWETVGKILLQVKMEENDYFKKNISMMFINKWLESLFSNLTINKLNKYGWYEYSGYEINKDNIDSFRTSIVSKTNKLKNLEITNEDISLWNETKIEIDKNGKEIEKKYFGYELKGQKYIYV
ncbi:hypothetical protein SGLAD_v1c04840 [Spiroplasma gladiatoris]|uniref:Lipoprotein n=1 Tax=Spiroplasma gladiatoris TaxID=2143 RepID=A0A4P7AIX7_9MOLU|nr:hypothetical protein [Spiroplasma gladiatoris]QBQ07683.1 hypothetical protein SGLAD_v1c04840 [Spiroplasma gladiatoris]